jgi:CDP-diacylglycerol--glycerol-3-phosphate 3-phosphatidyltransferase
VTAPEEQPGGVPPPAAPAGRVGEAPLVNAANALTLLRIVLVPVFAAFVVGSDMQRVGWRVAACAVFVIASGTDYVDGWVARRWGLVTSFGKVADPIADKALTGTALVLLSAYGRLPWWVTVVILFRELAVTGLRFWVIRREVMAASWAGKLKTALQIVAIGWLLLPVPAAVDWIVWWIMALAVGVTVLTGIDYAVRALRLRRAPRVRSLSRPSLFDPPPARVGDPPVIPPAGSAREEVG